MEVLFTGSLVTTVKKLDYSDVHFFSGMDVKKKCSSGEGVEGDKKGRQTGGLVLSYESSSPSD